MSETKTALQDAYTVYFDAIGAFDVARNNLLSAVVARERAAAQALADALKIIVDGDGEHSDPCGSCETCQMVGRDALKTWEART